MKQGVNDITGSKERCGVYKVYFSLMMCLICYIVDLTFCSVQRFRIIVY